MFDYAQILHGIGLMMVSILSHDQDIHTNTTTIAMHQLYEQAIEVREQIHSEHVFLLVAEEWASTMPVLYEISMVVTLNLVKFTSSITGYD